MVGGLTALLRRPVDIASLAAFRILFGALMLAASVRFLFKGWVHEEYEVPRYFFHYTFFDWVRPWPGPGMYVHFALMALAAALVTVGLHYRVSIAAFFVLFTYAHFIDKTNYLNHYYLVSCLSLVMIFLPLDRAWSVRVWRRPVLRWAMAPAWCLWLVRAQVACVYFFGGVAKLKTDWLRHAQPLTIWLGASTELPLLGAWFHEKWFAYAFSWAGAAFDLSIVGWLSWRRSRPLAYVAVLAFHAITGKLFQLGMFPWIMSAAATVFFDPSWPRRFVSPRGWHELRLLAPRTDDTLPKLPRYGAVLAALYIALQVTLPLRHWLYPGDVLWTEQGFRFAWNVMLIEKNGVVEMSIVERPSGRRSLVELRDYLTPFQIKMMSTQPDMILELAHIVRDDYARRGAGDVEVHVEAMVALNGRRAAPMVDPSVDLARVERGLGAQRWILPEPANAPEF